ncbi:MAG: MBL fold metallo-hydrolase [Cytophagaceae bacterium]|nr:MBL fold metallo-hydrolase [Cytophagaceae bacterium]
MLLKILAILLALVVAFVLIAVCIGYFFLSAPNYNGPVSDHFDGKQFINPGGAKPNGFPELIKWMTNRQRGPWEEVREERYGPKPPQRVGSGELRVTFVNHSTFLIQMDGLNILTDPIYLRRVSPFQWIGPKRMRSPGIRFDDLPKIDLLLLSHNHWDHLEISTVRRVVERDHPRVLTPLGVKQFLDENGAPGATDLDWGDEANINDSLTVVCVRAQHFSGRGMADRDATLWAGYVLKSPHGNVYFTGDSGYGSFFKETGAHYGPFRLAIIPIGAYKPEWFMSPIHCSPKEAVQIHLDVRSNQSLACHFGTFPLADDSYLDPIADLKTVLQTQQIPAERFWIFEEGEGRMVK